MQIDEEAICRAIGRHEDDLLARVRREVGAAVSSMSPSEALTFLWMDGERQSRAVAPTASADYAKTLIAFANRKPIGCYRIESAVTPRAMQAVQEAIVGFYASRGVSDAIVDAILEQLGNRPPADRPEEERPAEERVQPGSTREWLARELGAIGNFDAVHSVGGDLASASADQLKAFFRTALGRKILLALGKALAASTGKVMILRLVQAAVQKGMTSAAFQSALVASLRKVGLGALVKSAVGKTIVALLAVAGVAHIPLVWVVLPVIAGFLVYEYRHFPAKLADRLPGAAADAVAGNFAAMNGIVVGTLLASTLREIVGELAKLRAAPA